VASLNTPLLRFFAASLSLHLLLLLLWGKPSIRARPQESIAVSLLPPPPPPEESRSTPLPGPKEAPRRPSKTSPAKIAKKDSPLLREKTATLKEKTVAPQELPPQKEPTREEARPPAREQIPDKAIVAERPLPTLKELLPPMGWSADGRVGGANGPIQLDTKDPQYVTYFNSIKRAIEVM